MLVLQDTSRSPAASKESIVLCGHEELPWTKILNAMQSLLLTENFASTLSIIRLSSESYTAHQNFQTVQLDELLYLSNHRAASNPLHVIYGVCGLVRQPRKELPKLDYSLSVENVYQDTMVYIIEIRQDLDFLIHAATQRRVDKTKKASNLAGWCVDFSSKTSRLDPTELTRLPQRYSTTNIGASFGRRFFGVTQHVEISGLEVTGTIVGRVADTIRITRFNSNLEAQSKIDVIGKLFKDLSLVTAFARAVWTEASNLVIANSKIEAGHVWKVVANGREPERVSGELPNFKLPYNTSTRHVKTALDFATIWPEVFKISADENAQERLALRGDLVGDEVETLIHAHGKLVATGVHNVKVFATDTGFVGSVYVTLGKDDMICILFGCQLPVILRPAKYGTFTLVDAVYVDGIMGGQFLETTDCSEKSFVLV